MAPQAPPASPKLIEVPEKTASTVSKALPATVFILTNGERLEARRYLLTHETLSLTIDGQQRDIPVPMLNIAATIAADRERGITLRIPADRNEISLGI
jgi:hypothetical protein